MAFFRGISVQERLERSDLGRAAIGAFLIVLLVSVAATNITNSHLRFEVNKRGQPLLNALGLDQGWGVFAPDPRTQTLGFYANVRFSDGSIERWRMPVGGAALGVYWDNRWRKYLEYIVAEQFRPVLWRPAAVYVARRAAAGGKTPVQVTLHRSVEQLLPPGKGPDAKPVKRGAYYRLAVTPAMLRGAG